MGSKHQQSGKLGKLNEDAERRQVNGNLLSRRFGPTPSSYKNFHLVNMMILAVKVIL